jgi:hypothetical protein
VARTKLTPLIDRHTGLGPPFRPHEAPTRVEPSVVVVDLCVVSERGRDADWCDNMQQYSWRLWRAPMLTSNAISHAKWHRLKLSRCERTSSSRLGSKILIENAQPLSLHLSYSGISSGYRAAAMSPYSVRLHGRPDNSCQDGSLYVAIEGRDVLSFTPAAGHATLVGS